MVDDVKRRTFEVNVLCGRRRPSAGIGGPHLSLMAEPLMKATAPIFASAIPIHSRWARGSRRETWHYNRRKRLDEPIERRPLKGKDSLSRDQLL